MRVTNISFYYLFDVNRDHIFKGHTHGTYEMAVVLEGNLEITIDETVVKLSKGDMLYWPAIIPHNNRALSDSTRFISIHFGLENSILADKKIVFCHLGHEQMRIVKLLMSEVQEHCHPKYGTANITTLQNENGELPGGAAAVSLLEALIIIGAQSPHAPELSDDASAQVFHRAIDIIKANLTCELDVPEIARLAGVCQTTLKTAFRRHAGIGVKSYYNELKTEAAKEMLESGKSITEIAFALGFSSSSYFSQFFKKHSGMRPKDYVRQNK